MTSEADRERAERNLLSSLAEKLGRYLAEPVKGYAARRISEGIIDWLFSLVTPEDVINSVRSDEPLAIMLLRCILSSLPYNIAEMLTPEKMFLWLRERRPDLASVILSVDGGVEWFEKSVMHLSSLYLQSRREPARQG